MSRAGSSHSPCLAPRTRPRYGSTISMKLWRNSTRRSPVSAQNRPASMARAIAEPDGAADERAEEPRGGGLAQPAFEQDDQAGQDEGEGDVGGRRPTGSG